MTVNRATIAFLSQTYKTPAIIDIPTVCYAMSLVEQSLTGNIYDRIVKSVKRLQCGTIGHARPI